VRSSRSDDSLGDIFRRSGRFRGKDADEAFVATVLLKLCEEADLIVVSEVWAV